MRAAREISRRASTRTRSTVTTPSSPSAPRARPRRPSRRAPPATSRRQLLALHCRLRTSRVFHTSRCEPARGPTARTRWSTSSPALLATTVLDVSACSRAGWGQPGSASATTPLTISACEWETYTNSGVDWVVDAPTGTWPGYGGAGHRHTHRPPPRRTRRATSSSSRSMTRQSRRARSTEGHRGWVRLSRHLWQLHDHHADRQRGRQVGFDRHRWLGDEPVQGRPVQPLDERPGHRPTCLRLHRAKCQRRSDRGHCRLRLLGRGAGGAQSYYHILGWAKFYLSGYKIGGSPDTERASRVSGTVPCSGAVRCISGWFVQGTLAKATTVVPPTTGGVDLGTYGVVPLG